MLSMGRPDGARPEEFCLHLQKKLRQLLAAGSQAAGPAPSAHRLWHEGRGSLTSVNRSLWPGAEAYSRPMHPLLGQRGTQLASVLSMGARPGGMRVASTSCLRQLQEKLRRLLAAGGHALATGLASSAHRQWHEGRGSLSPVTGGCAGMAVGHRD